MCSHDMDQITDYRSAVDRIRPICDGNLIHFSPYQAHIIPYSRPIPTYPDSLSTSLTAATSGYRRFVRTVDRFVGIAGLQIGFSRMKMLPN
ncbi:hypothetical protein AFLA_004345 [Aspergillus flavus NRRL3357]|nr:hypothetical protein AFLA_004345 [Aspergillus flavus NRRL3357]